MFPGGIDRKLIKEYAGHRSDAVDAYQDTSNQQHEELSKIIAGPGEASNIKAKPEIELAISEKIYNCITGCSCAKLQFDINSTDQIGDLVTKVLNAKPGVIAKVRLEIEFL